MPQVDPRIQKLLTQISPERLKMILTRLGSFGTRSTLSSTDSTTHRSRRRTTPES
jgi:hypothetical protein